MIKVYTPITYRMFITFVTNNIRVSETKLIATWNWKTMTVYW